MNKAANYKWQLYLILVEAVQKGQKTDLFKQPLSFI
jgi:hypothetical protein